MGQTVFQSVKQDDVNRVTLTLFKVTLFTGPMVVKGRYKEKSKQ
jgi:hypothetical protein